MLNIYTIGFAEKSAEEFFGLIKKNNIKKIIDTRINNSSQLSGFAKSKDLSFFLNSLCGTEYTWKPDMAPTKELLKAYRNKEMPWDEYEKIYLDTIAARNIAKKYSPDFFENACLLCSEHLPHQCHRKILAEYLIKQWGSKFNIVHLV